MQQVQLFIKDQDNVYQRIELFQDETISLTQSIQNVKDISKVFTDFTKTFTIPATKSTNKLFKHYYNFDILGGFDARKKTDGLIKLNGVDFKEGKIKLDGVNLKENKPSSYKVTFFGSVVELKESLGERKLSDLDFSTYNLDYSPDDVKSKLTTPESQSNHVIAPLITHTQRLYYDSVTHVPDTGNLFWHTGSGSHVHGVKWNELKYAIRVNKIIEQIEADPSFNFTFSSDFFKNTSVDEFDQLFLWMHRETGAVKNLSNTGGIETFVDGFTDATETRFYATYSINNSILTIPSGVSFLSFDYFNLNLATPSTTPYSVRIERNGTSVYTSSNNTGNLTVSGTGEDFYIAPGNYTVYITAESAITFNSISWGFNEERFPPVSDPVSFSISSYTTSGSFVFNVSNQMPDIKIIDFLTGLFKCFNLTAYVEDNVIVVKTLDDFYSSNTTYDITKYVDVNDKTVNVALPYREVTFKFKDTSSFLANQFSELNNRSWGEASTYDLIDGTEKLSGQIYKVEAPFGHMMFERLNDFANGDQKNIQWGWSVDKSQNSYLGSPLLFYPININSGDISFIDEVDGDNVALDKVDIQNVNMPFNSVSDNPNTDSNQLNFYREISEWTLDTSYEDTLYSDFYDTYIRDVFNQKNRLTRIKAYLPLTILVNYSLADTFVIAGKKYKINSITTNLQTGESDMELLNEV
jgi:hypothetical protein